MSEKWFRVVLLVGMLSLSGCANFPRHGLDATHAQELAQQIARRNGPLPGDLENRVLALDPEHVSGEDVAEVLSRCPAPRIINIHGGVHPVHLRMVSFSEFLIGMGYPAASITNPADGTYSFSCYESSTMIAGMIAWYYEQEGFRPMLVGHSQGGMQMVKVLHKLAGSSQWSFPVWNPLTWKPEQRHTITDPLTGEIRPVTGLRLPYATAVGAGGLSRFLPNQWDLWFSLRSIPNSVEDFTGFYKNKDLLGGDFLGYGAANRFWATGTARVRNVELPAEWKHGAIPDTRHLLKSQEIKDRINAYQPSAQSLVVVPGNPETLADETLHLFWASDVWFSIKKHWVLELQRSIRARRQLPNGN